MNGKREGGDMSGKRKTIRERLERKLAKRAADGLSHWDKLLDALIEAGEQGNVRAFLAIRDTCGEKPTDRIQAQASGTLDIGTLEEARKRVISPIVKEYIDSIKGETGAQQ